MGVGRCGISLKVFNVVHLMIEHSEQVRYQLEHLKINSISLSNHVLFYLLHKQLTNKMSLFQVRTENHRTHCHSFMV